jgi:glutamate 5-kinase
MATHSDCLRDAKRIVVKLGTSTIAHPNGELDMHRLEKLVGQMAEAARDGREVIVVTSGAIGVGMSRLGLLERPKTLPEKQAVAAVGQGLLMESYERLFREYAQVVAQVLLTREDVTERVRHLNARHTLTQLLSFGVIPIVNENDTVAVDEIKFGENDTLSSLVAALVGADLLILLSDVDGLHSADPHRVPDARRIPVIAEITPEIQELGGGPGSPLGSGGMATKIQAARIATLSGVAMVVANGAHEDVIRRILDGGDVGTLFLPSSQSLGSRKRWIAFYQQAQGDLIIDAGAAKALIEDGKSLLPIGIVGIRGFFEEGDLVRMVDSEGREVARGLTNYASGDVERVKGLPTSRIATILGEKYYDEVVHRDNLVISGGKRIPPGSNGDQWSLCSGGAC